MNARFSFLIIISVALLATLAGCGGAAPAVATSAPVATKTAAPTTDVGAIQTQAAANIFATQTASAPTATATTAATATSAATSTKPASTSAPTRTTAPTSTPSSLGGSSDASFISQVVIARETQATTFDPIDILSTYATTDAKFHAVATLKDAPANSALKAVWYAVDVGTAAAKNSKIDETAVTTEGSRNVDFTLTANSGKWPEGTYRVEIFGNGAQAWAQLFSVSKSGEKTNFIDQTVLAKDTTPDVFEPQDITMVFAPDDKVFHFVVVLKDAPSNSKLGVTWYFGEQEIDTANLTISGTRNVDFTLKQQKPWPPSSFHANLFVNGKFERTVFFSVQ